MLVGGENDQTGLCYDVKCHRFSFEGFLKERLDEVNWMMQYVLP